VEKNPVKMEKKLVLVWTQQPPHASSPTVMNNVFHLISAALAGAAE
jgi:hypothetical protein